MKKKIKISVLMSVYNTDFKLVKRALDSVLAQSFQDFEIIVVDDGSDEDPENRLLNYVKAHSQKITCLRHSNCGQALSINKAVLISRGELITIIDADDEYKKEHLASCLAELKDSDLIASNTENVVDKEEDYYVPDKYDPKKLIHIDDCIMFATLFGKREVFEKIQFHEGYAADSDFYDLASKKYKVRKVDLRTYIYYRNHPDSITAKMKREYSNPKNELNPFQKESKNPKRTIHFFCSLQSAKNSCLKESALPDSNTDNL